MMEMLAPFSGGTVLFTASIESTESTVPMRVSYLHRIHTIHTIHTPYILYRE